MIVDTSAIIAILRNEPDASVLAEVLQRVPVRLDEPLLFKDDDFRHTDVEVAR